MKKIAVILFNLGGPDGQEAVKPFLYNLFSDAAIIRIPQPFRYLVAKLISWRRAPIAREIYAKMGGGSPILRNTRAQSEALEEALNTDADAHYKIFIAMRYWHPFADEAVREVKKFVPDEIILLPLYPQFSTTTTESSFKDWAEAARKEDLRVPTKSVCCYPQEDGLIRAMVASIKVAYEKAQVFGKPRILFSAHGLPEKIIRDGDPYQAQCILTADSLRRALNIDYLDSQLCFQSRVGPLAWISPATDDEVKRAGRDKVPVVIVPIAFVSDHSETLVELDIEYRHLAEQCGVSFYAFVPAVGAAPLFIQSLARLARAARGQKQECLSGVGGRICSPEFTDCICSQK